MKELSLAQKAMLNGSVCPYCKIPSTITVVCDMDMSYGDCIKKRNNKFGR